MLDPACGSGNFLYVALQHLKLLEGEVLDTAAQFGENFKLELETHTIDPHQFLGIELNPRAASIAELVLWIGYLQWHFKIHGERTPPEPVLRAFKNIECRDAVLAWDGEPLPARDERGEVVTVWDRRSMKTDLVTGRSVPDESKRVPLLTYPNARPAEWQKADFIVGNPPFIGARTIRRYVGDGYLNALRPTYPNVAENVDFVMYWWEKAAQQTRDGKVNRFGFITTNSFTQSFNRSVVEKHLRGARPLSIRFAVPDHPWVDAEDGANVRIAMTVGVCSKDPGVLMRIVHEEPGDADGAVVEFTNTEGNIEPNLTIGEDTGASAELKANEGMCCVGYQLTGTGFTVTREQIANLTTGEREETRGLIFPLLSARDITQEPRGLHAIDLCRFRNIDDVMHNFPRVYQWVLNHVKPERDSNPRAALRERWWIYGEARNTFRPALEGIKRIIVTPLTAKHRPFIFSPRNTIADSTTVMFALDDAFHLGVLSSRIHVTFSLAAGGTLEDRPRYNKTLCFDPFPFPDCDDEKKEEIRKIAEELDAHRKRVQAQHPGLSLTAMYNVLEALREGRPLSKKEQDIHDRGLVSILRQLHDALDWKVTYAYESEDSPHGWAKLAHELYGLQHGSTLDPVTGLPASRPSDPAAAAAQLAAAQAAFDQKVLTNLVALNATRAAEEAAGKIRWLRPDYQAPAAAQTTLGITAKPGKGAKPAKQKAKKTPWPKPLAERVKATEQALREAATAVTPSELAKRFLRAKPEDLAEILDTLVAMSRAHKEGEKFSV